MPPEVTTMFSTATIIITAVVALVGGLYLLALAFPALRAGFNKVSQMLGIAGRR